MAAKLAQRAVVKGELEKVADQLKLPRRRVVGADVADGGVDYVHLLRRSHGVGLGDGVGVGLPIAIEQGGGEFAVSVPVVVQQGCVGRFVRLRRGCVVRGYLPLFSKVGVMVGVLDQGRRDAAALGAEFRSDFPLFGQGRMTSAW